MKEKILVKFSDILAFNATIKNVADVILKDFRECNFIDPTSELDDDGDGTCDLCDVLDARDVPGKSFFSNKPSQCGFV